MWDTGLKTTTDFPSFPLSPTHTHTQRWKKMCKTTLTYVRREINPDRAGCPQSVLSSLRMQWSLKIFLPACRLGGNCFCCCFPPSDFLLMVLEQGKHLLCKPDIHCNHCWRNLSWYQQYQALCQEKYTVTWKKIKRILESFYLPLSLACLCHCSFVCMQRELELIFF